jgi:putative nucleotidyltransferase with HDIG domain
MQNFSLREELLSCAETLNVLPTLNAVVDEVLRVLADENSSFNRLFNVVRYDQAISSKVISIANSAYFSRGFRITNLERAMVAIGFDEIKRIVMCLVFLKEMFHQRNFSQADLLTLWTHTLSVACAAKALAAKMMSEDREKVFTVSILHDIGKAPLFMQGDLYGKLLEEAKSTGADICSLESQTFAIDHQEIGQFMATKWRFPEEFKAVIRKHHGRVETGVPLIDIVAKADRFIENPSADIGAEGAVLREQADSIKSETKRISDLLGVA